MRLFFIARTENLDPRMEAICPPLGWLRVDGRLPFGDGVLSAELSIVLRESLPPEEMANEITVRLLPVYRDFLDAMRRHSLKDETRPPEQVGVPRQRTSTEQEAALYFIRFMREKAQPAWPGIYRTFKDTFGVKFVVADETMAAFDLFLATIALDLQAVKNLFQAEQANRLERWVFKNIGGVEHWGNYAVGEVTEYSSAFQNKLRVDMPIGAISARLVHRWLGGGIRNFEAEIGGKKTGFIDVLLIDAVNETLLGFIGFWKGIKTDFTLVEGDLPLGEVIVTDEHIPF